MNVVQDRARKQTHHCFPLTACYHPTKQHIHYRFLKQQPYPSAHAPDDRPLIRFLQSQYKDNHRTDAKHECVNRTSVLPPRYYRFPDNKKTPLHPFQSKNRLYPYDTMRLLPKYVHTV